MIKNLLDDEPQQSETARAGKGSRSGPLSLFGNEQNDDGPESGGAYAPPAEPETVAENIRRSGLAWSAGVVFFSSVVFMLILGWGADLLLGIEPWGKVGGIVLGALIGFIQFFRLTSQIFRK